MLGLAFVFTGELDSLGREDAQDLVKRYGGRVTTAPSGKTDFVVVGRNAGESKMKKIAALGLKTLDEDGLLDLVRTSTPGRNADTVDVDHKVISSDHDIVGIENVDMYHPSPKKKLPKVTVVHPELAYTELWTDKYAPQTENDLIGNHSNYEKLVDWLRDYPSSSSANTMKAVLISGPPGIGKTTAAHMACRQLEFEVVEMNASDTRNKTNLHDHIRDMIDNRSLAGFFSVNKEVQTLLQFMSLNS